jgi:hypothetical protein
MVLGNGLTSPLRLLLRLDKPLLALLLVHAVLFVPLIPRATDNARMLAAFGNDEVPLCMALDGMTVRPYGNPGNYLEDDAVFGKRPVPDYWYNIRYSGFLYYGGTYLDLGLLVYAPLKALGFAAFPWAPLILRSLSYLAAAGGLILLYRFGKPIVGPGPALVPVVLMMMDTQFAGYTRLIHPDTLQMLIGLLVLTVASAHAGSGRWSSLTCLGLLCGVHHGTKMGGPWLAPMALLATWWGWRTAQAAAEVPARRAWAQLAGRLLWLGFLTFNAFFLTTPYAFLDPYYFKCIKAWSAILLQNTLTEVTFWSWFQGLWTHLGGPLFIAFAVALVCLPFRGDRDGARRPLLLAAVLIVGNLLWFAMLGRTWVMVCYYICAIALLGLLLTDLCLRLGRQIQERAHLWRPLAYVPVLGLLLALVPERWSYIPYDNLLILCGRQNTQLSVGRWAEEHLDPHARIVYDDVAYFDPQRFTNQTMQGGILTYAGLVQLRPEYVVLSESLYGAAWYVELRKTQNLKRSDSSPFSMRLYQDLINARPDPYQLGATGVPGIELIAVVPGAASPVPYPGPGTSPPLLDLIRNWSPGLWYRGYCLYHVARSALGIDTRPIGPTMLVYRVDPAFAIPPD